MLTPQEVSERAFPKAGFGGYNMAMVDEFLDTLTEDYTALYKENAALKGKMKVLAEKVEEYRATEDAMRKALLTAQSMADEIVSEAEKRKAELLGKAEEEAMNRLGSLRQEVAAEQARLTAAKNAAAVYLDKLRKMYQKELDYLSSLEASVGVEPPPAPKADPVAAAVAEIESNMNRMMEEEISKAPVAEGKEAPKSTEYENPFAQYMAPKAEEAPKPQGGKKQDTRSFTPAGSKQENRENRDNRPRPFRGQENRPKDRSDRRPFQNRNNNGGEPEDPDQSAAPKNEQPTAGRIDLNDLQFGKDFDLE